MEQLFWGVCYETDLDSLFMKQKKLVRIMTYSGRFAHTTNRSPKYVFAHPCMYFLAHVCIP